MTEQATKLESNYPPHIAGTFLSSMLTFCHSSFQCLPGLYKHVHKTCGSLQKSPFFCYLWHLDFYFLPATEQPSQGSPTCAAAGPITIHLPETSSGATFKGRGGEKHPLFLHRVAPNPCSSSQGCVSWESLPLPHAASHTVSAGTRVGMGWPMALTGKQAGSTAACSSHGSKVLFIHPESCFVFACFPCHCRPGMLSFSRLISNWETDREVRLGGRWNDRTVFLVLIYLQNFILTGFSCCRKSIRSCFFFFHLFDFSVVEEKSVYMSVYYSVQI